MVKELIFSVFGGLGLFIYGIHLMGEGLQNAAGDRMRRLLKALTSNTLAGTVVGAGITAIIQSSSATTVMVVGFVNAGLMGLEQAIGVIFGANIGTTITAQIIAFKLTNYALPAIAIGACLYLFVPKRFWKFFGLFLLGFGILFLGLQTMTSVIKDYSDRPAVISAFISFSKNPALAVLTGAVVTAIFQSSSVTTGMIITLASLGLFDLQGAIPLIFGCNIGTCITAILASIGTTISARRAALAHVLFNVLVTVIFLPTLGFYYKIIALTSGDIARQVANAHTIFNVIGTVIFVPFAAVFAKVVTRVLPGKDIIIDTQPKFLEKHLLATPIAAFDAAMKETMRMAEITRGMIDDAMKGFLDNDLKILAFVSKKEIAVDSLQEAITNYLMEIMQKELSPAIANKIPSLLHSVNDIERVGDHSENLKELAERKIVNNLPFSADALADIKAMFELVDLMAEATIKCLDTDEIKDAGVVLEMEEKVNAITFKLRENHINRLAKGSCKVLSGIVFLDIISNFEKIADHFTNVAEAVAGKLQWSKPVQTIKPQKKQLV
ncbi:MAG: Na/Pi cotransporter family protein [Candidatus Omnitrophica bacterium]|nr:Na/Pi cotransporter family protein [Candidatus Omnitrophota bacterium]